MNNYLITMIDLEDPSTPIFYRVKGMNEDEAKYSFVPKAFKALSDFGYDWDGIKEMLDNKNIALIITNETVIESVE